MTTGPTYDLTRARRRRLSRTVTTTPSAVKLTSITDAGVVGDLTAAPERTRRGHADFAPPGDTELPESVTAADVARMTCRHDATSQPLKNEVGVRELHDRLSRYVQHVQGGAEVVVTMLGRRVARLVPVAELDPLADLRARAPGSRDRSRPVTRALNARVESRQARVPTS